AVSRTFVFAGPAILGWLWHTYSGPFMTWEQRDPSGATIRGNGEQELDPMGADAGTFASAVPPTEGPIISFGSSFNPANPNFTYWVNGVRVPVDDFVQLAGMKLRDTFGLLETWARETAQPIGYQKSGVSWGHRFEIIYDANGKVVSQNWSF